jgi:Bacterial membrane protein YfhO
MRPIAHYQITNMNILKNLLPHLIAYIVMIAVCFLYFKPYTFDGKELSRGDLMQSKGMQGESNTFVNKGENAPLWTNAMFSGMPAYQIVNNTANPIKYPFTYMLLGNPMMSAHTNMLILMLGFYILMISLGVDWRLGLAGSMAFGLSGSNMMRIEAGHATMVVATAYIAPIVAGVIQAFRGRYLIGGAMTAFFVAMQIYANHVQITYYMLMVLAILGIVYLVRAVQKGTLPQFAKAAAVLVVAVALGFATSTSRLWTTYEYSQETIRGKSELRKKEADSSTSADGKGLSKDYAFSWSYSILETFNTIVPNFMGGNSSDFFVQDKDSESLKALRKMGEKGQPYAEATSKYWGEQPFTSGPVYFGAVVWFLFLLGAFLVRGSFKWWAVSGVIFTIMLAWGKHFPILNYTLFDYFPMFNKFRAVTMVLGVTNVLMAMLGIVGLQRFLTGKEDFETKRAALIKAGIGAGGLCVLALLLSFGVDYGVSDKNLPADLARALQTDRAGILRMDAFRSLLFIGAAFGTLWAFLTTAFQPALAVLVVGMAMLMDNYGISRRFLNDEDYQNKKEISQKIAPTPADLEIMKDKEPSFRVADFRRGNPFADAFTSYHHKSIGGYHAAKLMRYQELIERYLSDPNKSMHLYSMLNAKYFITPAGEGRPENVQRNPDALGNVWFVKNYVIVKDADTEMDSLARLKPKETAILQGQVAFKGEGFNIQYDSTNSIKLTSYYPDKMVYQSNAKTDQLAVFSEIFYPENKGWKMMIDGQAVSILKANYLLRAAKIPAGNHTITMTFEPNSFYTGEKITMASAIGIMLLALGAIVLQLKKSGFPDPNRLPKTSIVAEADLPRKEEPVATLAKTQKKK